MKKYDLKHGSYRRFVKVASLMYSICAWALFSPTPTHGQTGELDCEQVLQRDLLAASYSEEASGHLFKLLQTSSLSGSDLKTGGEIVYQGVPLSGYLNWSETKRSSFLEQVGYSYERSSALALLSQRLPEAVKAYSAWYGCKELQARANSLGLFLSAKPLGRSDAVVTIIWRPPAGASSITITPELTTLSGGRPLGDTGDSHQLLTQEATLTGVGQLPVHIERTPGSDYLAATVRDRVGNSDDARMQWPSDQPPVVMDPPEKLPPTVPVYAYWSSDQRYRYTPKSGQAVAGWQGGRVDFHAFQVEVPGAVQLKEYVKPGNFGWNFVTWTEPLFGGLRYDAAGIWVFRSQKPGTTEYFVYQADFHQGFKDSDPKYLFSSDPNIGGGWKRTDLRFFAYASPQQQ